MADIAKEDQAITVCCSLAAAASLGAATVLSKRKKRKNSTWIKPYVGQQESIGAFNALLSEMATHELTRCFQYGIDKWTLQLWRNYS